MEKPKTNPDAETKQVPPATQSPTPEAWEEFLEENADCCGGCHHKPR